MKFFYVCAFLPLIVGSIYVDPKCSGGESYWCSSLVNAKSCLAVDHCKTTIWKNQAITMDTTEVCQFCETIISDVSEYLRDKKNEEFVASFLQSACDIIPNVKMLDECKKLVTEYLPEILDIISLDLDKQVICNLLGLCNNGLAFKDNVKHPFQQVQSLPSESSRIQIKGTLCEDCTQFITDFKIKFFGKETQGKIIDLLDAYFCRLTGSLKNKCENFVNKELPLIMQGIADKIQPKACCQAFCAEGENDFSKEMEKLFNVVQEVTMNANADECATCKLIVGELQVLDENKQVQKMILDNIEMYICPALGNYTKECDNLVELYLPLLFQFLASELDPASRCRSLGFCTKQESNTIPMLQLEPAAPRRHLVDGDKKGELMGSVDGDKKGDLVGRVKVSPQCVICEFVMSELKKIIGDNATEASIIAALDAVCMRLPKTVQSQCTSFMDLYAKAILDLLMQDLQPEEICTILGLCSATSKLKFSPQKLSSSCEVCEITMQYLESLLDQQSSIDSIKKTLDKICNFLPETMKQECTKIVDMYEPLIIDFLINKLTPKKICQELRLCTAQMVPTLAPPTIKTGTPASAPPPATRERLYYKCTYGPSYWCASEANAALCQAAEHCKKYVW